MIYKNDLLALQAQVQQYYPDGKVVLSDESSLLVFGLKDSLVSVTFDVSASLFARAVKATGSSVFIKDGNKTTRICDLVYLAEGVNLGQVKVDGLLMYNLKSIIARFNYKGSMSGDSSLANRIIAQRLAEYQEEQAKSKQVVPPATPQPTWGELTEVEQVFEQRCIKADWYYSYSDDIRVYRAGKEVCDSLEKEARANGGNHQLIYRYYSTR